ncbi:(2Fe-2S)-binding protein [Mesorhizobium sp. 1B3]|uniref:(2Fe-2S)-binding protein n=1 Tax=Mesorhizobium sp. 1B3 TaxID=3243599 RepID=UPI003D98D4C0
MNSHAVSKLRLTINGQPYELSIDPHRTLLDLLREDLHLTGTKKGCDHGQCGACTVHIDGKMRLSCLQFAAQIDGCEVLTIEGVTDECGGLHPVQQAFIKWDALQCGYCTPGQIMSAISLLKDHPDATEPEIRELMSGNLCRCGAHDNIVKAIRAVADAVA